MKYLPFKELRVLELASVLAGPAVGLFFAELGATVIKIENKKTNGDVTRKWKAPTEAVDKTDSSYYYSVNFFKENRFLDLSQEADKQAVYELVQQSDIVITNYKFGAAEKLGMDYEKLKSFNPTLIYAALSGFGVNDKRPAFDVVLQAETGFLYLTGEPGRLPIKMPVALIDLLAAHQLKEGILVALLEKTKTGKGCQVEVNLYDAAIASLANQATNWLIAGYSPQAIGNQHPNIAPYGDLFETADGLLIVLAIGTEKQFKQFCEVIQLPELAADERFSINAQRIANRAALNAALRPKIKTFTRASLLQICQESQVPIGAVRDLPDVFAQPASQRMLVTHKDDAGNLIQSVRSVVFDLKA